MYIKNYACYGCRFNLIEMFYFFNHVYQVREVTKTVLVHTEQVYSYDVCLYCYTMCNWTDKFTFISIHVEEDVEMEIINRDINNTTIKSSF